MLSLESAVGEEKRRLASLDRLLMEEGLSAADILELEKCRDCAAANAESSGDSDVVVSSL